MKPKVMRSLMLIALNAALLGEAAGSIFEADARRGADLFATQMCLRCHSVNGKGGTVAPDLGRRTDRDYTPDLLASLMWNHAPTMWKTARSEGIQLPPLSETQAADLFAYFYSVRFFEKPGDAARGKRTFNSKHCVDCHAVAGGGPGAPVNSWESLGDPIMLLTRVWNHTAQMRTAFVEKKIAWPQLTAQDMTDLLVYVQNLPHTRTTVEEFSLVPPDTGKALFESKGCADCHHGKLALEGRLGHTTLTSVAAAMWNHAPQMLQMPPALSEDEMRRIVSYVWGTQFFASQGVAARGKRMFAEKNCAKCHNDPSSGAPSLARGKNAYSSITVVSALWKHGPRMLERMEQKNLPWPRFTSGQMSDLVAYLNTL